MQGNFFNLSECKLSIAIAVGYHICMKRILVWLLFGEEDVASSLYLFVNAVPEFRYSVVARSYHQQ